MRRRRDREPAGLFGDLQWPGAAGPQAALARLESPGWLRLQRLDEVRRSGSDRQSEQPAGRKQRQRRRRATVLPTFGTVFINAKWQFNVSGTVQLPLGITSPRTSSAVRDSSSRTSSTWPRTTRDNPPDIQIGQVDAYRLPDVYQLDLHLEKLLRIGSRVTVTPSLDCFNVANSHTVLGRDGSVGGWDNGAEEPFSPSDEFNAVTERLSDRTFRVGVRVSF